MKVFKKMLKNLIFNHLTRQKDARKASRNHSARNLRISANKPRTSSILNRPDPALSLIPTHSLNHLITNHQPPNHYFNCV